jgi:hypothetical protein
MWARPKITTFPARLVHVPGETPHSDYFLRVTGIFQNYDRETAPAQNRAGMSFLAYVFHDAGV